MSKLPNCPEVNWEPCPTRKQFAKEVKIAKPAVAAAAPHHNLKPTPVAATTKSHPVAPVHHKAAPVRSKAAPSPAHQQSRVVATTKKPSVLAQAAAAGVHKPTRYIPVALRTHIDRARMPAYRQPQALRSPAPTSWQLAQQMRQRQAWVAGVRDWRNA